MERNKEVLNFYKQRFNKHGESVLSLGWNKPQEQLIRFQALVRNFDDLLAKSNSVVDFGCGLAHFLPWLRNRGYAGQYIGVDIVDMFLEKNRQVYPGYDFISSESFLNLPVKYDLIFSSGVFTIPWGENHAKMVLNTIEQLFDKCNYGLAFNMLSSYTIFKNPHYCYFNPLTVLKFCQTLASECVLHAGYLPNDFTIIMRKK